MQETMTALKACNDAAARREIVRRRILKLRWIGHGDEAEKLSAEIARILPDLVLTDSLETD